MGRSAGTTAGATSFDATGACATIVVTCATRAEFRRMACWVRHLEQEPRPERTGPEQFATVVVGPYLPAWLADPATRAPLTLTSAGAGCYQVGPRDHTVLWVAANELPLHPSLIPFLWARSGRPLVAFVRWLSGVRGVERVARVLGSHPMSAQIAQQVIDTPDESEEDYRRGVETARILLKGYPEAANEIREQSLEKGIEKGIEKGAEQTLSRQFERKLARSLGASEHDVLTQRIHTLGDARVGDVVLDLVAPELDAWLRDPDAR